MTPRFDRVARRWIVALTVLIGLLGCGALHLLGWTTANYNPALRWKQHAGAGFDTAPVLAGGRLYTVDGNRILAAHDAATGQQVWRVDTNGIYLTAPLVR